MLLVTFGNILCLQFVLSDVSVATATFWWLPFAWCLFVSPFIISLFSICIFEPKMCFICEMFLFYVVIRMTFFTASLLLNHSNKILFTLTLWRNSPTFSSSTWLVLLFYIYVFDPFRTYSCVWHELWILFYLFPNC